MNSYSEQPSSSVNLAIAALVVGGGMIGSAWVVSPLSAPATPADGVILVGWWVCVLIAAWLVGSVIMWRVALGSNWAGLSALAARIAAPGTQRLAKSTLALTLVVGAGACSVSAVSDAPTLSLISTGVPFTPIAPTTALSTTSAQSTTSPVDLIEEEVPSVREPLWEPHPYFDLPEAPAPNTSAPAVVMLAYEVVDGDNLWEIARATLVRQLGSEPLSLQIAPYWRELVFVNRNSIRSGDPNLIYPGEVFQLPSLDD